MPLQSPIYGLRIFSARKRLIAKPLDILQIRDGKNILQNGAMFASAEGR
jgi:hypothetical protein